MKSQHGQQGIPDAHILHCPSEFREFQQAALRKWGRRISQDYCCCYHLLFCVWCVLLFGIIKQVQHLCGVAK